MRTQRARIVFIWLSGTILLSGLGAHSEPSSAAPDLETAAIRPLEADAAVTVLDPHVSSATLSSENDIRGLEPQAFYGLPNMDTLDLSKNQLDDESFSQNPLSNLTFLKKLNLDGNQLTRIPALPASLTELKINDNKLSTLSPSCFKGLTNLLNLELRENILHEDSVSPLAFRPLKGLLILRLDNNRFRSLPLGLPHSLQVH
ncbi:hypothetical protein F2P81_011533 [Scophthalmus maximus]|uniref:Uncharacterized protein n=1 Tax=Scophthalmus maximus TaxID=52904 RepID=A0A6A4SYX9_SCOMX|nr:hypothetical protein F2P81_011533 [Scophthalmus maximus]